MSMIDDLNELPVTYPKPCAFQTIRELDGDERYQEVMELVAVDDTVPRKRVILEQYGYRISATTVGTHVKGRCRQCQ